MSSTIKKLTALFYSSAEELGVFEPVEATDLPEEYQSLLSHHDHMTVTVEAWYNSLVVLGVVEEKSEASFYARKSVLTLQRDSTPVQLGIMRIDLDGLPEIVRLEIESRALPLGRILIRHHIMREVELCQLWRVNPGVDLRLRLSLEEGQTIYARTARILVSGKPAVELLEMVKA